MASFASFLSPIREFFSLRRAERTIRGYTAIQHERVAFHRAAAEKRWLAGRRTGHSLPAAILLREAVLAYLRANELARDANADTDALTPQSLARALPPVPADPLARDRVQADTEAVQAAVASSDSLYLDRLEPAALARTRAALERAAAALRPRIESRSLLHLRAVRYGRVAAILLVIGVVSYREARHVFWPNLALGKPVLASSLSPLSPDPEELVDGEIGVSNFGIATNTEESAWVEVDLGRVHKVDTVLIYNRADGWFDDSLPLLLQTSVDGAHWTDVARRDAPFSVTSPWSERIGHEPVRFVRVRGLSRAAITLSEIEVRGAR